MRLLFALQIFTVILIHPCVGNTAAFAKPGQVPQSSANYSYKIIRSPGNTWGYDIYSGKAVFIHQPNVPGNAGNIGFKLAKSAKKVALLVIAKLKRNEFPPSISAQELKTLNAL